MSRIVTSAVCLSAALLLACGDDGKPQDSITMEPATGNDGNNQPIVDAGEEKDAGDSNPTPSCDDDATTPGNDCPTAVGCRGEAACGLEAQSCCVPGFDVENVACIDGLACTTGGRATCDGPEDCGGKSCCVDTSAGTTSCQDSCDAFQLCHKDEDCPVGAECKAGKSFTWWGICG